MKVNNVSGPQELSLSSFQFSKSLSRDYLEMHATPFFSDMGKFKRIARKFSNGTEMRNFLLHECQALKKGLRCRQFEKCCLMSENYNFLTDLNVRKNYSI